MPIEIITNYITITDDMNLVHQLDAQFANSAVETMELGFKNSDISKLDPNDGRKVIIILTADVEKFVIIDRKFLAP